ncbi:Cell division protein FtsA [bioreactor metagenome]|uniref:Cell division protein FtsA n=1 Tax=bioreactor metagenome TaxID=1076179 RepID=A0A644SV12_9ZZZZ|nr:cell division FtsA domain-containing protein [Negativicutes bacterium]
MEKKLLFALDIGTRSVVGLVGEQHENNISLIAVERQEHNTRAMLDGQIHDVPEVANVLIAIRERLEQKCGPLTKVAVAAAGRALCTITAFAETEVFGKGLLATNDERTLELTAIQTAQHQLATSNSIDDPAGYYCVGYSVVNFTLDGTEFKTLVGQRGRLAGVKVIATFLPRQVIDSLQAALQKAGLEMDTLTLEPIAAINILIPPTMRHLNLALIDVGAGTSDVAITRDGSVVGYGMVPSAGDEITEALSRNYLLDFNVAEKVKRKINNASKRKITFTDILGCSQKFAASEIATTVSTNVTELAQAIATEILTLNTTAPQAVLLVGGGALTPMLPEALAEALAISAKRVAIRKPDGIEGILTIPPLLMAPDGITPLGILKLAGSKTLNFVNVTLNGQPFHLFNLGNLTVADSLLAAGINIRSLQGRPGMGLTVTVNNKTKFLPGTHGQPGLITVNENPASFTDPIHDNDVIRVTKGIDGTAPTPVVHEAVEIPTPFTVTVNEKRIEVSPIITVNGCVAQADTKLSDRAEISCLLPTTLDEILTIAGNKLKPHHYRYQVNEGERSYAVWPQLTVNGKPAKVDKTVSPGDLITIAPGPLPALGTLLGIKDDPQEVIQVLLNGANCCVPTRRYTFLVNGKLANLSDIPSAGSTIEYSCFEQPNPMVTDVLLTAEFDTRNLPPGTRVEILLNGQPAEYTETIKPKDAIDIILSNLDHGSPAL